MEPTHRKPQLSCDHFADPLESVLQGAERSHGSQGILRSAPRPSQAMQYVTRSPPPLEGYQPKSPRHKLLRAKLFDRHD
eukprot:Skav201423  [mRNA]  locus=scaffold201:86820:93186:+ [translate_table: standard]